MTLYMRTLKQQFFLSAPIFYDFSAALVSPGKIPWYEAHSIYRESSHGSLRAILQIRTQF
jgi:hypothetical protein